MRNKAIAWLKQQAVKAQTYRLNGTFEEMTGKTWMFVAVVGLVFVFGPMIYHLVYGGVGSSVNLTSSNFNTFQDYAG